MSTKTKKKRKKRASLRTWVFRILMGLCLVIFCYSGWKLFEIWQGNHQIEKETETLKQYLQQGTATPVPSNGENSAVEDQPQGTTSTESYFSVDWEGLKAANPNVVAWLIVPGTGISYPVVQGADNDYYLNHSFNGQYNELGAVFLDCTANPDFLDDNSMIYGHSVDIGGMFTALKNFTNLNFFESHPYFWLLTPSQNYRCEIVAFYKGNDDSAIYTVDFGDYEHEVMQQIYQEAMYTRDLNLDGKHFVTLSTCNLDYGYSSNQRYVLMGVLQEWNELIPVSMTK